MHISTITLIEYDYSITFSLRGSHNPTDSMKMNNARTKRVSPPMTVHAFFFIIGGFQR